MVHVLWSEGVQVVAVGAGSSAWPGEASSRPYHVVNRSSS